MKKEKTIRAGTSLAHEGRNPEDHMGAVNVPIFHASTMIFPTLKKFRDQDAPSPYGRQNTPTTDALCEAIAKREGMVSGKHSFLAPSGLAAIACAILSVVKSGDHILMSDGIYHPTRSLCDHFLSKMNIQTDYYDPAIAPEALAQAFRPNTSLLYMESPSSLTFEMQDVPNLAALAREKGAKSIIDNTWATPLYFRPLEHGVDISVHSGTKYLSGHSDSILGVATAHEGAREPLRLTHKTLGLCASSNESYLTLRGMRSLHLRMKRHEENGLKLAEFLLTRPEILKILHPAHQSHPQHKIWKRDYSGAAGLFGALLKPASEEALAAMFDPMRFFAMGYSWGGFESLMIPADFVRTASPRRKKEEGIFIRIHAGLEDYEDLKNDLAEGLDRLSAYKNL